MRWKTGLDNSHKHTGTTLLTLLTTFALSLAMSVSYQRRGLVKCLALHVLSKNEETFPAIYDFAISGRITEVSQYRGKHSCTGVQKVYKILRMSEICFKWRLRSAARIVAEAGTKVTSTTQIGHLRRGRKDYDHTTASSTTTG